MRDTSIFGSSWVVTTFPLNRPDDRVRRPQALRELTGRTEEHLLIEAIRDYLQNLEDLCEAKQVVRDLESGKTRTVPLESVLRKYRLAA